MPGPGLGLGLGLGLGPGPCPPSPGRDPGPGFVACVAHSMCVFAVTSSGRLASILRPLSPAVSFRGPTAPLSFCTLLTQLTRLTQLTHLTHLTPPRKAP